MGDCSRYVPAVIRCSILLLGALVLSVKVFAQAFEIPTKTTQFPDGRIVFPRNDAKSGPDNSLIWEYKPTRWGMYDVALVTSDAIAPKDVQIQIAGQKLGGTAGPREELEDSSVFPVGRFYLAKSELFQLRVSGSKPESLSKLKAVLLRAAPEGKPIVQDGESITLRARDATTHSTMMRFEPATNKNCLGFWTNPKDTAEWKFTVAKTGTYEIEAWQGCGKGQGGSAVSVEIDDPIFSSRAGLIKEARFIVEDTGHFQNFIPRNLGRVTFELSGEHTCVVRPLNKKAAAVMDIRQIVLKPVNALAAVGNPGLESVLANQRVIFLGDSITHSGEYIEYLETYLRLRYPASAVEFINLGLPSETLSGLSEPGHAGGQFPRPDLHERLERVLEKAKPEIIFACYGMNDGIYHPFSGKRFGAFEGGLRQLRASATHVGAMLIHVTPPTFDPLPIKDRTLPAGHDEYRLPFENYNETLDMYSKWLADQRVSGWEVIDVHTAMNRFLIRQRASDPKFILAGDGVHANAQGHWVMAREILRYIGATEELTSAPTADALLRVSPRAAQVLELVRKRQRLRRDAWLTEVGHKRPGMNKGKPLAEAEREAAEISKQIASLSVL